LYISEQQRLIFAFANNKLYGVEVHELPETVFADLKTKYGDKKTIALNDDNYILVDTAAWNDGQRFIVYCRYSNYTTKEYYRTAVFYYDANYLKPLMKKAIQNFRASRSSRLD
jgi:hypothetical protein